MTNSKQTNMVLIGGWMLITFSVLYVGITLLIDHFADSQAMLYTVQHDNLFHVAEGSGMIRFLLVVYALLPLLIIPGAVGMYYSQMNTNEPVTRVGMYFALIGVFALTLSIAMIPSMNWLVLTHLNSLPVETQKVMIILLQALHTYLGIFVGDFIGFGCLIVWFFITSFTMIRYSTVPGYIGLIQLILAFCALFIIILRYSGFLPEIHNNLQAPGIITLWLFIAGISLVSLRKD